ncbi:MAG: response regulator transcription factor [Treponema sp.]|nr:response regulator transcription factor [Treponema sp.]MCL2251444.1 response regulator transcription factor [Treponema sp.]
MSDKGIVLLVEDNQNILDINRRLLEKEGVMVLTATTIEQARQRIKLARPDVAVLDIMLPDGSGLDFLSELRSLCETPSNPVCALFLTAKAERADILAGLCAGSNDYITKPYDIDEFRMRVLGFLRLTVTQRKEDTQPKQHGQEKPISSLLTEKELAVAMLAARGFANKEIADNVFLSESRVKTCLSGIYRKLGISDKENKRDILIKMLKK